MKTSLLSRSVLGLTLGLGCITAQAADSQFTSSTNLTFTSDYMFRGVSQTSSTPAVQGGMTLSHKSGVYASVWGSSVSFANMELDPSVGFANSVGDVGYDVGIVRYGYPGYSSAVQGGLPFTETYGKLSWKGASIGVYWTDNYFGGTGRALYTTLGYGTEVKGVGIAASVGQSQYDELTFNKEDSYLDYSLTLSKSFAGYGFSLAVIGSDMDEDDCAAFSGDANSCSTRAVASISKSL